MRRALSLICFLFCAGTLVFGQIESGKTGSKKKRKQTENDKGPNTKLPVSDDYTLLTFSYSYGSSFRSLKENGSFYGEPIGIRADEKRLPVSGFYLGANTKFDKKIHLDFALGFQKFGEQYESSDSDTLLSYKTTYSQLVLPLKIQYQSGSKIIFFIGTGFQAQLLGTYLNNSKTTIEGKETQVKTRILDNKNAFSIASTSSVGVQIPLNRKTNFVVSADYVQQLSNTFNKQASYIHRSNLIALKAGIGIKL